MTSSQPTEAGIDALIARLRDEGVAAGKTDAERIVAEAEARARSILDKAEADAKAARDGARREAEQLRRGAEEAIRVAMRDAVLDLKQGLATRFARRIEGSVSRITGDDEMLKRLILTVAARAREDADIDGADAIEVVLPRAVVGLDDLRRRPEELREGSLSHFVAAMAADLLRDGVRFARAEGDEDGIRIVLRDEGVVVDLTDRAVAEVILRHLQPRFRALLEGVVS